MSRSGDEMMLELSGLLNTNTVKTAAKKDDKDDKADKKEEKKEKAEKKKEKEKEEEEKAAKKDEKKKKEDKKASVMLGVIQDLVKLASDLDDVGAEVASGLVDDALKVIVDGLEKKKLARYDDPEPGSLFNKMPGEEFAKRKPATQDQHRDRMVKWLMEGRGSDWAKGLRGEDKKLFDEFVSDVHRSEYMTYNNPRSTTPDKDSLDSAEWSAEYEGENPADVRNFLSDEERQTKGIGEED